MTSKIIIVKHDGKSWTVRRPNALKPLKRCNTRKEAYNYARNFALRNDLRIKVFNLAGQSKTISPIENTADEDCFLTTACVKYYKLKDDCIQLEMLRNYRDSVILKESNGLENIAKYYNISQKIISAIDESGKSKAYYRLIFWKINEASRLLQKGSYSEVREIYTEMLLFLENKLNLRYGG